MFILDQNVLNVIDGSRNDTNVRKWFSGLDETDIYICVITIFEIAKNASRLARRGRAVETQKIEATLDTLKRTFGSRILSLNPIAAENWGRMIGTSERALMDAAIAAIARENGFHVATRNVKDFVKRGATVTNPFRDPPQITSR